MPSIYGTIGARNQATGVTARNGGLPSGYSDGMLILVICGSENNADHSIDNTSGWTKAAQVNSGATWTVSLHWKIVSAGEAVPVVSWTGAADAFIQTFGFIGPFRPDEPIAIRSTNSGSGSPHTVTGFNTTRNNSLCIYFGAGNANTAYGAPGGGWAEGLDGGSTTGPSRNVLGWKNVATAGTASGDVSISGGTAAWVLWQIEFQIPFNEVSGDVTGLLPTVSGDVTSSAPARSISGDVVGLLPSVSGNIANTAPTFSISGDIVAPMGIASGTVTNTPPSREITGNVTGLLGVASGSVSFSSPDRSIAGSVVGLLPTVAGSVAYVPPNRTMSGDVVGLIGSVTGEIVSNDPSVPVNISGDVVGLLGVVTGGIFTNIIPTTNVTDDTVTNVITTTPAGGIDIIETSPGGAGVSVLDATKTTSDDVPLIYSSN